MNKISISLSGGGVNGLQYIGMLYSFEMNGYKPEQFIFHTSSIGSIIASLWYIGYSSKDLMNIFIQQDFEPDCNLINLFEFGGLDNTNKLYDILKNIIFKKCNKNICLDELPNIFIYTSNIIQNTFECFHSNNIELYKVISMSSCIPFIFPPISFDKNLYVDSALMNNTPNHHLVNVICFFKSSPISPIDIKSIYPDNNFNNIHLINYLLRLIECSSFNKTFDKINDNQFSFEFDKLFSSVDFWVSKNDKINLIKNGFLITNSHKVNYISFFNNILNVDNIIVEEK